MKKKVLIVAPVHEVLTNTLEALGYVCEQQLALRTEEAKKIVGAYSGIITSTRLQLDENFLAGAEQLEWIGRMGSGMEVIDTVYAASKGINCFSSPEGNANAVAEQALGMLLGLTHRIVHAHIEMQKGIWQREENRGWEIEGRTAGIIGYGHNGSAFARKLRAMGVNVLAYDKYKKGYGEHGIQECTSLNDIFHNADILSFHLPLNTETNYYFDRAFLDAMKKRFVLLNLSRGSVVEMTTLYEGIKEAKIVAAALDVWELEPVTRMVGVKSRQFQELMTMPNFIGTPHIGGYTREALYKMSYFLAEKIRESHSG